MHRHVAEVIDLHTHSGYYFHEWRRAMARSVGAVLLDDQLSGGDDADVNAS